MDCNINEVDDSKKSECFQKSVETNNNFEPNKEAGSSNGGDIDSTQSDALKISESREERIKRLKERSEIERQRKYTEIVESQRQSSELRQRQQEDRRKKIEELKLREEERKRKVEQRRQEMDAKEKEKNENFLKRTKEREERALLLQKQNRMAPSMTQSVTLTNPSRLTTSVHSSGASSGSEKCMKVYKRSSSGCDVHRVSSYVPQAAGNKASSVNTSRTGKKGPQIPDGFIEVAGHIIPANTRHIGCFVPYKGSHDKVKGVLAWGPPPDRVSERGSAVSWWAGIGERGGRPPSRATSAHASLIGCHGGTHMSTPQHLDKVSLMEENVVDIDIGSTNEQSLRSTKKNVYPRLSVKLMKTMSLRHLDSTVSSSSNRNSGKEAAPFTPRIRSSSRTRPTATATTTTRTPRHNNPKPAGEQALYDRLSKPRSGSHPPKNRTEESIEPISKVMSISVTKPASQKTTTVKVSSPPMKQPAVVLPTVTVTKKQSPKTKPVPITSTDSGITPSPVGEIEHVQDPTTVKESEDVSEATTTTTTTEEGLSGTKGRPRKTNKNLQNKELDTSVTVENTVEPEVSAIVSEEEMYRQKLAEQRRMKREAKERQQEEQRKLEEEAREKASLEKKRMEEETRLVIEEEARRTRELEVQEQEALEKQRQDDEIERIKREEIERDLEEKRREKLRADDLDRMERKRRLEQIMIRVKKPDDSSLLVADENNVGNGEMIEPCVTGDERNEPVMEIALTDNDKKQSDDAVCEGEDVCEPMNAWTIGEDPMAGSGDDVSAAQEPGDNEGQCSPVNTDNQAECSHPNTESPGLISESVLNLPGPQTNSNCMSQATDTVVLNTTASEPQFKSRLLQSMMAKGRLATSTNDVRRNSLLLNTPDGSLASDRTSMGAKRQSLILNQANGDLDSLDAMSHSMSFNSGISNMIELDHKRNGGESEEREKTHMSNGTRHSDTESSLSAVYCGVAGTGTEMMQHHRVSSVPVATSTSMAASQPS